MKPFAPMAGMKGLLSERLVLPGASTSVAWVSISTGASAAAGFEVAMLS